MKKLLIKEIEEIKQTVEALELLIDLVDEEFTQKHYVFVRELLIELKKGNIEITKALILSHKPGLWNNQ